MKKRMSSLLIALMLLCTALSTLSLPVSATDQVVYPTLNSTDEYYIYNYEGEDVLINFASAYQDENESVQWYKKYGDHSLYIKSVESIYEPDDGLIYTDGIYTLKEGDIEQSSNWEKLSNIDTTAGQLQYNIGSLPNGHHIVLVTSYLGDYPLQIVAKCNILIVDKGSDINGGYINTTEEYNLYYTSQEDAVINFANSYDDEGNETKWWRDNSRHGLLIKQVPSFDNHGYALYKNGNTYHITEPSCDEEYAPGWTSVLEEGMQVSQLQYNFGKLPAGNYIVLVQNHMYWQFPWIVAKFNITVSDPVKVMVNGESVNFDVQPRIINGRTMVPIRAIFESLGATVEWDAEQQRVYASKRYVPTNGIVSTEFVIGRSYMLTSFGNSQQKELDTPPMIINGRTLVPARAAAEAFDYNVEWDEATRTVYIYE